MKDLLFIGFFVTTMLLHLSTGQPFSEEKNDVLEWYYKLNQQNHNLNLPREKRQGNNFDYRDSSENENEDDWYVFDEVEPQQSQPSPNNANRNQFEWNPRQQQQQGSFEQGSFDQFNPNRPNQISNSSPRPQAPTTAAPRPQSPNAGPPRPSQCVQNCVARTTGEYNPVCGSDGMTYLSLAKMNCAASCGINVRIIREGRCVPLLPPAPSVASWPSTTD